jgi:PPOX class probable F420-dependent enzyme
MTNFPESHRDLLDAPVGILSAVGSSGIPHTTAIWFLHDQDGEIKLWLSDARHKMKILMHRPECSFFILDTANPQRYLCLRGRAELTPDNDCVVGDRLGKKYNVDVRGMVREGETRYAVTIRPTKVLVR